MTSAEVGHDALVDLSREEAFQAADDVAFGPASGETSGDVVAGRLVELHPDDDGSQALKQELTGDLAADRPP